MRWTFAASLAAAALCGSAWAETVTLSAVRDNCLIENLAVPIGNGGGIYFHCGLTGEFTRRRSVLAFDLTSIPAGSTVTAVTLQLNMSQTGTNDTYTVSVHRALTAWTEGTSDPPEGEGQGTLATPGDATWLNSSYPRQFWKNAGGDFDQTALASTPVTLPAPYAWSSPELTACVQDWVDDPSANLGFLLHGHEDAKFTVTSKRFDSRTNPNVNNRPRLIVEYELAPKPCPGDLDGSGQVDGIDLGILLVNWSLPPDEPGCGGQDCPADFNGDGFVNGIDLGIMLANWGKC